MERRQVLDTITMLFSMNPNNSGNSNDADSNDGDERKTEMADENQVDRLGFMEEDDRCVSTVAQGRTSKPG